MIIKIINNVNAALKLLVFIFLFKLSKFLKPECSIRIKYRPNIPIIRGNEKLRKKGKKEVKLMSKNEYKKTSVKDKKTKDNPIIKLNFRLS